MLYFKMSGKISFALEKFPDNMNLYIHEKSFKTQINVAGSMEKIHLVWKSFQKL